MNILIYDPLPSRLNQAVRALGEAYSVTAVQTPAEVRDVPTYDVVILDEEIDLHWLEHAIQNCPNTVFLIGMENKNVATIRKFTEIGAYDGINYPIEERRAFERILPPTLRDQVPDTRQFVATTKEEVFEQDQSQTDDPDEEEHENTPEPVPTPTNNRVNGRKTFQKPWNQPAEVQEVEDTAPPRKRETPVQSQESKRKPEPQQTQQTPKQEKRTRLFYDDPDEPYYQERQVSRTRQKIVAVTSARGGVGKSTITYNLAAAAAKWVKTVVVDVDPKGNLALLSRTDTTYNADTWAGLDIESLGEGRVKDYLSRMDCGADLLAAGREVEGIQSETLNKILDTLRKYYDLILIDCADGNIPICVESCLRADEVLFVVPDDNGAYKSCMSMINEMIYLFEMDARKIKIVLNKVDKDFDKQIIEILAKNTGSDILVTLPLVPDMKRILAKGQAASLDRKSRYAKPMNDLLQRVVYIPQAVPEQQSGVFSKLFRRRK